MVDKEALEKIGLVLMEVVKDSGVVISGQIQQFGIGGSPLIFGACCTTYNGPEFSTRRKDDPSSYQRISLTKPQFK